jgi:hypothetical protein
MSSNEFKINKVNIYVCVCENTNNDYFIKYLYIDDILILDDNIKYMIKFTKNMLTNKFDWKTWVLQMLYYK